MSDAIETLDRLRLRLREVEQYCARLHAEREQLRSALQNRALQQPQASLQTLAGGLAHEFNNLLTSIMGFTSLSLAEIPAEAASHEYLQQVLASAQQAAELCQQMLAYAGQGRYHLQSVDLNAQLRQFLASVRPGLVPTTQLIVDLAPDLPAVLADPAQLSQMILALLQNALESLPERRGRVNLATRAVVDPLDLPAGRYAAFEVSDTGIGMDGDTLQRAFEPFFSTKFAGRGLGLAAVQGIVRGHGGTIHATSKPGQGSSVQVLLPLAPNDQDAT